MLVIFWILQLFIMVLEFVILAHPFVLKYIQVLPSAAISYFVYEFMKIVLKVE